jgi:hypothetical protein
MKIYIAGSISNAPNYNAHAFYTTEAKLIAQGHTVLNPLRQDKALGIDTKHAVYGAGDGSVRRQVIKADLNWIIDNADEVVVLPGSRRSLGVKCEVATARAIGVPVYFIRKKTTKKQQVAGEVQQVGEFA